MLVNSTNPELNNTKGDNEHFLSIDIWVDSKLELAGTSKPSDIRYNASLYTAEVIKKESDIGKPVVHLYSIRNNGPSKIKEAEVFFIWPYATLDGQDLFYLLDQPHTLGNIKCERADANYKNYDLEYRTKTIWETLGIDPKKGYLHEAIAQGVILEEGEGATGVEVTGKEFNKVTNEKDRSSGDASFVHIERQKGHGSSSSASTSDGSSGTVVHVSQDTGGGSKVQTIEKHTSTTSWNTTSINGRPGVTHSFTRNTSVIIGPDGKPIHRETTSSGVVPGHGFGGFQHTPPKYGHDSQGGGKIIYSQSGGMQTSDGVYMSGGGLQGGGNIHTSGGSIHSSGGSTHSVGGSYHSSGESIHSSGGSIHSSGGSIHSSGGSMHSSGGSINSSSGNIHTSGGSMDTTAGSFHVSGGEVHTSEHSARPNIIYTSSGGPSHVSQVASGSTVSTTSETKINREEGKDYSITGGAISGRPATHTSGRFEWTSYGSESGQRYGGTSGGKHDTTLNMYSSEEYTGADLDQRLNQGSGGRGQYDHRTSYEQERRYGINRQGYDEEHRYGQENRYGEGHRAGQEHKTEQESRYGHRHEQEEEQRRRDELRYRQEQEQRYAQENRFGGKSNEEERRHHAYGGENGYAHETAYESKWQYGQGYGDHGPNIHSQSGRRDEDIRTHQGHSGSYNRSYHTNWNTHSQNQGQYGQDLSHVDMGSVALGSGGFKTTGIDLGVASSEGRTHPSGQYGGQLHSGGSHHYESHSSSKTWTSSDGTDDYEDYDSENFVGRDNVPTDRPDPQNRYYGRKKRQADPTDLDISQLIQCKSTKCLTVRCTVGPLNKHEDVLIALRARINYQTLKNVSIRLKYLSAKYIHPITKTNKTISF